MAKDFRTAIRQGIYGYCVSFREENEYGILVSRLIMKGVFEYDIDAGTSNGLDNEELTNSQKAYENLQRFRRRGTVDMDYKAELYCNPEYKRF